MDKAVESHHTAWVSVPGRDRTVPVRYAVSANMLVVFGDGALASLAPGDHTTVTVHEISCGRPLVTFGATVVELGPDTVEREALLELLAHVPLGPDIDTVNRTADAIARSRRIVGLAA